MSTILKQGKQFDFVDQFENLQQLPVGVYTLREGMFGRIYLEEANNFELPSKVYHNDTDFIEHVVKRYNNDPDKQNVGMLLTGKKGLGKTFTAKTICNRLQLPVIKIVNNFQGRIFDFLNKIQQPHTIFIDEFEKIFSEKSEAGEITQSQFLSFLDGSNSGTARKVFVITTNSSINTFFMNRPSRLNYVRNYNVISKEVVVEIVNDLLKETKHKDDLLANLDLDSLNIDILIKVIDEINITGKAYSTFKDFFNYVIEKADYEFSLINNDDSLTPLGSVSLPESGFKSKLHPHNDLYRDHKTRNYYYFSKLIKSDYDKWIVEAYTYLANGKEDDEPIHVKMLIKKEYSANIKYLF